MVPKFLLFFIFLNLNQFIFVTTQDEPLVCLEVGGACYQGSWIESEKGNKFASFQGIKYGIAPIGSLRFKSPQPYTPGEAFFDVRGESTIRCPQIDPNDGILHGNFLQKKNCIL